MKERNFSIPIKIDPARRQEIKELILYSSTDQGMHWNEEAHAGPERESFIFNAPADGLYWFTLCIVDQKGNKEPPDVAKAGPSQKILVDTHPPRLQIVSAERQGDEIAVGWELQEENPDLNSLKLEYRAGDTAQWYVATLVPLANGKTRFRFSNPGPVSVRMQVQDVAGNTTSATADVPGTAPSQPVVANTPPAVPNTPPGISAPPSPPVVTPPPSVPAGATQANYPVNNSAWATPPERPANTGRSDGYVAPESARPAPPAPTYVATNTWDTTTGHVPAVIASSPPSEGTTPSYAAGAARAPQAPSVPNVQLVKKKEVSFEYEVTNMGPSGLGKVELWMTQDEGRTWRFYAEDPDLKSPLTVDLPGEGIYGFTLVVKSRAGLGRRPPIPGETPEMRVEVDVTPPIAKLWPPQQEPSRRDALVMTWEVSDRNLDPNPITLEWAERPSGPWEVIGAKGLPNTGRYVWENLPKNLPSAGMVYLRLTAVDLAGNVAVAETAKPVLFDLNEPQPHLIRVVNYERKSGQ
jgi:hypothetical protein